jgi:hypothetical protein
MQNITFFDYARERPINPIKKLYERWKSGYKHINPIHHIIKKYSKDIYATEHHNLLQNPNFKLEYIPLLCRKTKYDIDYYYLSNNINITVDFVKQQLEKGIVDNKGFDIDILSNNDAFELSDILDRSIIPWYYKIAVSNNNISVRDILNHPDLPWEYNKLRKPIHIQNRVDLEKYAPILSAPITVDVIKSNPNIPWDWNILLPFYDLPFEFMLDHDDSKNSILADLYTNPNIPVQYCIDSLQDSFFISCKYNLTMSDVMNHPNFDWDWSAISQNPNITTDDIEQNPDLPWDWKFVSFNPNLTIAFIDKHIDKLWIDGLCKNDFIYNNWVGYKSMKKDFQFKHDFIVNTPGSGILKDLAEIVADYCGFQ